MAKAHAPITTFQGGLVSRLALARVDVSRLKFAAEQQTNWFPRAVGPMMLRPGLRYLDAIADAEATLPIPFIFSHTDTAMIEVSASAIRVRVNDARITRKAVSTTVPNGDFSASTDWIITDTSGATTTIAGDHVMKMEAHSFGSRCQAEQSIIVAPA